MTKQAENAGWVETCPYCGIEPGGYDGTIWCADCLSWWREQSRIARRAVFAQRKKADHAN